MNDRKTGLEVYHDGYRKQYRYFCRVCGMQLGDSAHSSYNVGTREEIGNLLCKTCKEKIDKGLIQPPKD